MMKSKRTAFLAFLFWLPLLTLWVCPWQATGQSAREHHQEGVKLFKADKFEQASQNFRKAYQLRPTWKLFYNIGQCEAAAKHYGPALESFEKYLVEGGDDVPTARRDYVSSEIRRIQPLVGVLQVEAPPGTMVIIDEEPRVTIPSMGPIRLAAGTHTVKLVRDEKLLLVKEIKMVGGMTITVSAAKHEKAAAKTEPKEGIPEPLPKEEPVKKKPSWMWTTGWIGLGVGAAVAIGGGITGGMAINKSDEFKGECQDKICPPDQEKVRDSADTLATVTNILLPVGGALAVAGAVLLVIGRPDKEEKQTDKTVTLIPVTGPGQAGLVLEGRF